MRLTIALLMVSLSAFSQNVSGKYKYLNSSKELNDNMPIYLYIKDDHTFMYVIQGEVSPIGGYEGKWKYKGGTIYFSNLPKDALNALKKSSIVKIEKQNIDSLRENDLSIEILSAEDSTVFIGATVSLDGKEFNIDGRSKIIVKSPVDSMVIRYFDKVVVYRFSKSETFNYLSFYVYFVFDPNYPIIKNLPFRKLRYEEPCLLLKKRPYFKRVLN